MPKSLRSILSPGSRVRKSSATTGKKQSSARRNKTEESSDHHLFTDPAYQDAGLEAMLVEEATLRDVVQAMRYVRDHMFAPVPETGGLGFVRRAELLRRRAGMPPLVTTGHMRAVLASSAPSRIEREIAELVARGTIRKVRVERRRIDAAVAAGEALIETTLLMDLLRRSCDAGTVGEATRAAYAAFLQRRPAAQELSAEEAALTPRAVNELVRAGFLTSAAASAATTVTATLHARPEDRTTLTSLERVSQSASGSLSAVGGRNALHMAGGSGGGGGGGSGRIASLSTTDLYHIAVPGHGLHLKLAETCVDWLRGALGRTEWGQGPEDWLRERFEAGGLRGPRWAELCGVEWAWVLGEAVGLGVVEIFQTRAVGRGVRAL